MESTWRSAGEGNCTRIAFKDCYTPVRHLAHTIILTKPKEMAAAPSLVKWGEKKLFWEPGWLGKPSKLMENVNRPGGLEVSSQSTSLIPSVLQTPNARKRE